MERNKKLKYISYLKEWKIEDEIIMTKPTEESDGREILSSASGASKSVRQDGENDEPENIVSGQTENDLLSDKIKNEAGNVIHIENWSFSNHFRIVTDQVFGPRIPDQC